MAIKDSKKLFSILIATGMSVAGAISGAFLVAPSEGAFNTTYIDPVGIATSCYGHTGSDVKAGSTYTDQECLDQLAKDLGEAETSVDKVIKVPLNDYQKAALISFTYNVGEGNLRKSSLAKAFNNKQYAAGCEGLASWVYARGKRLKGLESRREKEVQVCLGQLDLSYVINQ